MLERPLRTPLRICTEADYLQAHLTFIRGETRAGGRTLRDAKQRVVSLLKELIYEGNVQLSKPRVEDKNEG